LPDDHFDLVAFLGCVVNLFSDGTSPGDPPIVLELSFYWDPFLGFHSDNGRDAGCMFLEEEAHGVSIHVWRLEADPLYVCGPVDVTANPLQLGGKGGGAREVWRFDRITDRSGPVWYGDISWGGLLATYR